MPAGTNDPPNGEGEVEGDDAGGDDEGDGLTGGPDAGAVGTDDWVGPAGLTDGTGVAPTAGVAELVGVGGGSTA